MGTKITVRIKSEEQLKDTAAEMLQVMVNLRHFTKIWQQKYGFLPKQNKENWEKRADELIEKLIEKT